MKMIKLIKTTSIRNIRGDIETIYVNQDQILFFYRTTTKDFGVDHNKNREITRIRFSDGELQVEESVEDIFFQLKENQNA
jgi:hypothetical protein